VIAGRFGGRVLETPAGRATRPTGARVRGAWFNILHDVSGARVLDLYAGSGALALEALSRGAARAVLVEHDRAALASIETNVAALAVAERAVVISQRLPRALASLATTGPFDLVFCDPPWAELDQACGVLGEVVSRALLAPGARVSLEHAAKDESPAISGLVRHDQRAWGDTAVSFYGLL
jgi:16S rRNA (guanine(966)-N(2))-methyltransferase RsmD